MSLLFILYWCLYCLYENARNVKFCQALTVSQALFYTVNSQAKTLCKTWWTEQEMLKTSDIWCSGLPPSSRIFVDRYHNFSGLHSLLAVTSIIEQFELNGLEVWWLETGSESADQKTHRVKEAKSLSQIWWLHGSVTLQADQKATFMVNK